MLDTASFSVSGLTHESNASRNDHSPEGLSTVLVVDDDVDNLMLVSYVLEQFRCLLYCETDGQAGLESACSLRPDLIILDIRLPRLNGLEIIKNLRHRGLAGRAMPVIVVTALAGLEERSKALQAGASQYISKPYMLGEMRELISHHLASAEVASVA